MPCWEPPSPLTEPMSSLTRRFLTAAKEPVISCVQLPFSLNTRPCCAVATEIASNMNATILDNLFNISLPISSSNRLDDASRMDHSPSPHPLIELRKLRQNRSCLRPNVRILVVRRQLLQNPANTAIGAGWLQQAQ